MTEQRPFQPIVWEGIECSIDAQPGFELITSASARGNEEYRQMTQRILARSQETVARLEALRLFNPEIPSAPFILRLAVLPRKEFEQLLFKGMPNPQDWAWAKACVRRFDTSSFVTYDATIADDSWDSRLTMKADQIRENSHEVWHPYNENAVPAGMADSGSTGSIAYRDFTAEAVPRILFGLQHQMQDSTRFLLNLTDDQMLPLAEIDTRGWSCFPPIPLQFNPMYGGIFLAGLAAADIAGEGDIAQGTIHIIRTAQTCSKPADLWNTLIDQHWLLETTDLMKRGQEILRDYLWNTY